MTTIGTVAANFTRDLEQNYATIEQYVAEARTRGVDFLVFPEAAIGGYLSSLGNHGDTQKNSARSLPPAWCASNSAREIEPSPSRSSSAKCEPRRRLNASRAAESAVGTTVVITADESVRRAVSPALAAEL